MDLSEEAALAVKAAENERAWGPRNARAFARKNGVFELYVLARFLKRNPQWN